MKAKITKSESFDIEINSTTHYGFKIKEEWNGLILYENENGKVIATNVFTDEGFAFLMTKPKTEGETVIIKASPFFCDQP
jgi:hypothetical protein